MTKRRAKKRDYRIVIAAAVLAVLGLFGIGYEVGETRQVAACETRLQAVGGTRIAVDYLCHGRPLPAE